MKKSVFITIFLCSCCLMVTRAQELYSPDRNLRLNFGLNVQKTPVYKLTYKQQDVIKESKLGIAVNSGTNDMIRDFTVENIIYATEDSVWQPVWGTQKNIRCNYNEMLVELKNNNRTIRLRFRLFNDGLGFRYEFPRQPDLGYFVIKEELTEFCLTGDHKAFWLPGDYNNEEYRTSITPLSGIRPLLESGTLVCGESHPVFENKGIVAVQTPLMMKTAAGLYINIHEAAQINYATMQLQFDDENFVLTSHLVPDALGNKGYMQTDCNTPWRTILVSDDARAILASNTILNLNEPCAFEDVSWIKPVKYIGVWWEMFVAGSTWAYSDKTNTKLGITDYTQLPPNKTHAAKTPHVKKYIDFAAEHGFGQVLVEGWNVGWEDWIGNWKEEVFDFVTPYPDFNLAELREYAKERGVRLMMHHETSSAVTNYERRIDEAFRFMIDNNYNAVKTGYVGYPIPRGEWKSGQWMCNHFIRVAQKAADYKICINSHEAIRPTGLHRTYPNWLAQESARGNEYEAMSGLSPEHHCILPFTRLMGGPMDFTPGIFQTKLDYYNPENKRQVHTTLTKQLALYITMYSPLQMAADLIENYERFPDAFQFIKDVAVDWDDSYYLEAEPGDYITIARKTKAKEEWFVGAITNKNAREAVIDFSFLPANEQYTAIIYEDGKTAHWESNPMSYAIRKIKVSNKTKLKQKLAPGGGAVIHIL